MRIIFALLLEISSFIYAQNTDPGFWALSNGPFISKVNAISISPDGKIYCGTNLEGVFRSVDNGNSWQYLGLNTTIVSLLALDSGHVYIGTATSGLYHFNDLNNEWTYIDNNSPSNYLTCVAVDLEGKILVGTNSEGLYRLEEDGNWTRRGAFFEGRISTLFIDTFGRFVYVGTDSLYRSSESTYNWVNIDIEISSWINSIVINQNRSIFVSTYDKGIYTSSVDPINWLQLTTINAEVLTINAKGDIFAGTYNDGIYRSMDGGNSWRQINEGLIYTLEAKAILIDTNNNIFAGTSGGIYYSTNNGENWKQKNNGLGENGKPNSIVISLCSVKDKEIFVGTEFGGVYKSINCGESWISYNNGLPNNVSVYSMVDNTDNQLFATTLEGIYSLKNNDTLWFKTKFDIRVDAITINSNDTIFASANDGLYISGDNGENWSRNLLPDGNNIYTLGFDKNNYLWATTLNSIFISRDNGMNWNKIDSSKSNIRSMAINENNTIFIGANEGLYRSFNNGTSWEKVLDNSNVSSILITSAGDIFAGSYGEGIHLSIDNGNNWEKITQGLHKGWITELIIDTAGYIFAGIGSRELIPGSGGGVVRSINSVTSVKNDTSELNAIVKSSFILQNYPNPFNSSTNIKVNILYTSLVSLKIFNISGEIVATIINNKKMSAGYYDFIWRAENISTGIYFIRLTINNIATKVLKVIYLK